LYRRDAHYILMEPRDKMMLSLALVLSLSLGQVTPSCFGKDASWQTNAKPTVSQPSKNEPENVLITWGNIIKNVKCVDKFFVWVWPDGTLKTGASARKIEVDKNKISAIIDVEPCIGYRFALESEEDDMRKNFHSTSDILFRTQAIPMVRDLDKSKFTVGYHWDPIRHVSDLKLASIKFPKNLLKNANCLDYIQVTGSEVRGAPSLSRHSSTASMTGQVAWGHLGMERPGSRSNRPSISVGPASTLPASVSRQVSGSSQSRTVSPPRGPLAKTYSSSSSVSTSSLPFGNSPFGAIETPRYANTLPRATSKGATKQVGPVRTQPPFLNDTIELLITAPDCAEFNFEVKMYAAKSKEIGKVQVHLPALANIPTYIPPPVTEVMSISFGTSGKPIYGVKTSSGVSAACLPAYFEASDAYRQRLENEIGYFAGQTDNGNDQISQTADKTEKIDEQTLKHHGCVCPSANIKFTTTDTKIEKEHPEFFGRYTYKAMHENHPAYEKAGKKPMFLFYEKKKAQWVFGPTLGSSTGVEYGSVEKGTAKCPADPPAVGTWMRKTSFLHRWKKEPSLIVNCMR